MPWCTYRGPGTTLDVRPHLPPCLRYIRLQFASLSSRFHGFSCLDLLRLLRRNHTGITDTCYCAQFDLEIKLGPHVWVASTLLTGTAPSLLFCFVFLNLTSNILCFKFPFYLMFKSLAPFCGSNIIYRVQKNLILQDDQ